MAERPLRIPFLDPDDETCVSSSLAALAFLLLSPILFDREGLTTALSSRFDFDLAFFFGSPSTVRVPPFRMPFFEVPTATSILLDLPCSFPLALRASSAMAESELLEAVVEPFLST